MKTFKKLTALIVAVALCLSASIAFAKVYKISDVISSDEAYEAIQNMLNQKYMTLVKDKFYPAKNVTRGEFSMMLTRMNGDLTTLSNPSTPSFKDVPKSDQFYRYIETEKSFIPAFGTTFKPKSYLTREDAAYAIVKAMGYDKEEAIQDGVEPGVDLDEIIADYSKISSKLRQYVAIAIANDLIDVSTMGDEDFFEPKKSITRKQLAVLIDNALDHGDYTK